MLIDNIIKLLIIKYGDSMKWNLNYIQKYAKPSFKFNEKIKFEKNLITKITGLYNLENIEVEGVLRFLESTEHCFIEFNVKGIMKMKCALTNEDLDYEFNDSDSVTFSFSTSDSDYEIILAKGNTIDLTPFVWQLIVVNVPLKVVKKDIKLENNINLNTKNDIKEDKIDPRLECLKNYFDKH